ncbi:hypothetical protein [Fictibacillus norfolkensis]|uniref:Uncharacterized protein n=1 Tax=Fictibacillus norfolkensis TaxID=2762233 RepID=A0ABR8SMR8_9BACL|nr:hypothetical protein [Fictibacillus norfolkensis]MBD7964795.1 hypothetical protein [Fictibacillus norfolkensis]
MKLQGPITFTLVMLTGTLLKFFIPEHWTVWQGALLAGGIVGITLWGFIKIGLAKKTISTWLGVSLMIAAFFTSVYLANLYEKDSNTLNKNSTFDELN